MGSRVEGCHVIRWRGNRAWLRVKVGMSSGKAVTLPGSVGAARKVSPNWSQKTMLFFYKVASVWG